MESEALVVGLTWEWRWSEGFGEMEKWGLHLLRENHTDRVMRGLRLLDTIGDETVRLIVKWALVKV